MDDPHAAYRRAVYVRVVTGGHEADAFQASNPQLLEAALRPVYGLLAGRDDKVELRGIEEEWLPLGIDYVRREEELADLETARAFLAA